MTSIEPLALLSNPPSRSPLSAYRFAAGVLLSELAAPWLAPFRTVEPYSPGGIVPLLDPPGAHRKSLFDGVVELAGTTRRVRASRAEPTGTYEIRIEIDVAPPRASGSAGDGRALCFRVHPSGTHLSYDWDPGESRPAELVELALGAPTLLALALRGCFCLHASAVLASEGVVAFLGDSGSGKSTIARELDARGARRIADDLLLVRLGAAPRVLPRFPQPRLTGAEQPASNPREVPLAAIHVLRGASPALEREPLAPAVAALAISRHTAASRLFDADLMERHLAFSAAVARSVPVSGLAYPWQPGGVDAVLHALLGDLSRSTSGPP